MGLPSDPEVALAEGMAGARLEVIPQYLHNRLTLIPVLFGLRVHCVSQVASSWRHDRNVGKINR